MVQMGDVCSPLQHANRQEDAVFEFEGLLSNKDVFEMFW